MKGWHIFVVAIMLVSVLSISACTVETPEELPKPNGDDVYTHPQPPYSKNSAGELVHLINNSSAVGPTWDRLKDFLVLDATDQRHYNLYSYPCAAFAETVHNNAEEAGIRAAWVAVDFIDSDEIHALNAFVTIDKGLVYVDCTGDDPLIVCLPIYTFDYSTKTVVKHPCEPDSYDKIAYVAVDKEYGLVSLDTATSPSYDFYEGYTDRNEEYNREVEAYNQDAEAYIQALGGRSSLAEPEYAYFMSWHNRLESRRLELEVMREGLGDFSWKSLGTVASIEIYW